MTAPAQAAPTRAPGPLLAVLLLILLARLLTLGAYPLSDSTEARYAEIARKMVELDDWITPWYDYGVPFWGKPPLSTWITAISIKLFGATELAARLPHFLAGLLVLGLLADWLRRRSARQALLASALLAGSLLFFVAAGAVMTDMTLAVGTTLAMRGFWLGLFGTGNERRHAQWQFFIGLALGLLAKGPVALVLCALPIALWAISTRHVRTVVHGLPWIAGALLVLLLAAPWYALAERHTPGFLHYFFAGEHWNRFTVPGWSGDRYGTAHAEPPGMIWLYAVAACLPWALLLPVLLLRRRAHPPPQQPRSLAGYLWAWALAPCLFFTTSRNIIWTYVLPGMPALAMLGAGWLARDSNAGRVDKVVIAGLLLALASFGATLGLRQLQHGFSSAKGAVAAVQARQAGAGSLIFVGHRLYSAAFYSRGQARQVPDPAALARLLGAGAPAVRFVALQEAQWEQLPPQVQQQLHPLAQFDIYALYTVQPPPVPLARAGTRP